MNEIFAASDWPNDDAKRGWAARTMLAEDARWVSDIVVSAKLVGHVNSYVPLLLGHHFVRIAYEGAVALRSKNPHVGWPPLANLLTDHYASITERGRHVSKVLDDSKKGYEGVLTELQDALEINRNALTGKAPRWLRWMETDLALYSMNSSVLGANVPMTYRLGLDATDPHIMSGGPLKAISEEWGATVAALSVADLREPDLTPTLNFTGCKIVNSDRLATKYLSSRYQKEFADELKSLLLMIEGDLNTNRLFLPLTTKGHEFATFRARTVTVFHALSALRKIEQRFPDLNTSGMHGLRVLLSEPQALRLMCREAELVRNRCVHYEMNNPAINLNSSMPMSGIIETVYPGNTWENFDADVSFVTERLANHLASWTI